MVKETETEGLAVSMEQKESANQAEQMMEEYCNKVVATPDDFMQFGELLKKVKGKIKELDKMRKEKTAPLDKLKKDWMEWFNKPINVLKKAEEHLKKQMLEFQAKEDARIKAEEDKARKEQEKKARELQAKADKATEQGKTDKAEELQEQAQQTETAAPIVASISPKVKGISTSKVWKYNVVNEKKVPRNFLMVDTVKLGKFVDATKGEMPVEGVQFYQETVMSARG